MADETVTPAPQSGQPEPPQVPLPPWAVDLQDKNLFPNLQIIAQLGTKKNQSRPSNTSLKEMTLVVTILKNMVRAEDIYSTISKHDIEHIIRITREIVKNIIVGLGCNVLNTEYPPERNNRNTLHVNYLKECCMLSSTLLLQHYEMSMVPFLKQCLDPDSNYYRPHFDERTRRTIQGRSDICIMFTDYFITKYSSILSVLCSTPFIGVDQSSDLLHLLNLLGPENEKYGNEMVSSDTAHEAALQFMERLKIAVSEDDLKMRYKDNEKSLAPLWFQLETLCGHPGLGRMDDDAPWFWLNEIDYTYYTTNNLQQRLFGLGEFIYWTTQINKKKRKLDKRLLKTKNYIEW
jgi:hypothetical protein